MAEGTIPGAQLITQAENRTHTTWHVWNGPQLTLHALDGTYAARRAPELNASLQHALAELTKLLEPPPATSQQPIDLYLVDPASGSLPAEDPHAAAARPPSSPSQASLRGREESPNAGRGYDERYPPRPALGEGDEGRGPRAAFVPLQPETPPAAILPELTRCAIAQWFGDNAAQPALIVGGLAGVIADRVHFGPELEAIDAGLRADLKAGKPVSIFARETPAAAVAGTGEPDPMATSFVAFLLNTAGGTKALRQFLTAYDPNRSDQAALTAYQRPLGALEEGWQHYLERDSSGRTPFRALLHHLVPLVKPYWVRELEVLALMIVGVVLNLALPVASKYLVDSVIAKHSLHNLVIFIIVLLVIYVVSAVVGMRRSYAAGWVNQRILLSLQEKLFSQMQHLPHAFYAKAKVGDLISRLSNDLEVVQMAMTTFVGTGVYLAFSALAAAITLIVLSPLLGILVLVVVPMFVGSFLLLRQRFQTASYEYQTRMGETLTAAQENLSAQPVVKAFGLELHSIETFHARLMAMFKSYMRLVLIGSLFQASMTLATTFGELVVLGVGGYLAINGHLSVGTLLAAMGLLPSLFQPVAALSGVGQTVQQASGALDRVNELLDEPITIADKPEAKPLPPLERDIHLAHVTFGYDDNRPTFHDLELTIPAGSNVAFVGPSGAGKSTVINLLLRFWDPQQGQVLFDGHDLRDVTLASLRGQIGLVFQDTFIFDSTVRDNIAIGRPDATDADIAAAAKGAQLDSFIAGLPAGMDTLLGERGVRMSGGQRQRLAIARALLRDPRILILDEATSALDPGTEAEIQETLAEASRGRTTISITHRLTSATGADKIFVLNQGRLVEQGTHAELMQANGLYKQLYEEQTSMGATIAARRLTVEADHLRAIPLFHGLSDDLLTRVAGQMVLERYGSGTDIVRQGDPGDTLYLIGRGQVDILHSNGVKDRRINTLTTGDYFGEMALLADQPRTATVRATESSELYSLARADFDVLLQRAPALRGAIAATMAQRQAALLKLGAALPGTEVPGETGEG